MTERIKTEYERFLKEFKNEDYERYIKGEITLTSLCIKYGVSPHVFDLMLKHKKLKKRRILLQENTSHTFFDNINEEIKAYLLGFYYADGCISNNKLQIGVDFKDKEIIDYFKENIAPLNKITEYISKRKNKNGSYTHMFSLTINSDKICEKLEKYGMGHRKTYKELEDLSFIQDNVMRHFIRGYFDGDGSVYYHKGKKKYKLKNGTIKEYEYINRIWYIISYTKPHLVIIQNWLYRNGIKANVYNDGRDNFILSVTKKDSFFKLRDLLYNNSNFFLKRKRDKFMLIY